MTRYTFVAIACLTVAFVAGMAVADASPDSRDGHDSSGSVTNGDSDSAGSDLARAVEGSIPDQTMGTCAPGFGCEAAVDYPELVDEMGDHMFGNLIMKDRAQVRMQDGAIIFGSTPAELQDGQIHEDDLMDFSLPNGLSRIGAQDAFLHMPVSVTDSLQIKSGGAIIIQDGADLVIEDGGGIVQSGGDALITTEDNFTVKVNQDVAIFVQETANAPEVGIGTDDPLDTLDVNGNIVPHVNASFTLGRPDLRWTDLYLNSVIHHNGDLVFQNSAGAETARLGTSGFLEVANGASIGGNITAVGGIYALQGGYIANGLHVGGAMTADSFPQITPAAIGAVAIDLSCPASEYLVGHDANGVLCEPLPPETLGWSLTGNAGLTPGAAFLGTTDNVRLDLRQNDVTVVSVFRPTSGDDTPHVILGNVASHTVQTNPFAENGATISGGRNHVTYGRLPTIGGGDANQAKHDFATVAGGFDNVASGYASAIGGGYNNDNAGSYSTIAGGINHYVGGVQYATISGGYQNAAGAAASVGDGLRNTATQTSTIAGGSDNLAQGTNGAVGGGSNNGIWAGQYSTIAGGINNYVASSRAFIGGGEANYAGPGDYVTIAGGRDNTVGLSIYDVTHYGTVAGGRDNLVVDNYGTIGGGYQNTVGTSGVGATPGPYATVAGGQGNTASGIQASVGGGLSNTASGPRATVAGGASNQATQWDSFVGGGILNTASATGSAVGGGQGNVAAGLHSFVGSGTSNNNSAQGGAIGGGNANQITGRWATIPGGASNLAGGDYSVAMGRQAQATHFGALVWADANAFNFTSSAANEFSARSTGGARFVSAIDGTGAPTAGVALAPGGGSWATISDRNLKENIAPVNAGAVLDAVASLPISEWNYIAQHDNVRHMGPMAQDFHAAFGLGPSDQTIDTVDADGVALAAIQGLNSKLEAENAELRTMLISMEDRLSALEAVGAGNTHQAAGTASPNLVKTPANTLTFALVAAGALVGALLAAGVALGLRRVKTS